MNEIEINCIQCGTKTREVDNITFTATVEGREIVITRLTGTRCPTCGEEYLGADSLDKVEEITKKFRKPKVVFKRKITTSGGRRVLGIPDEIDRALGKKENADIWLEGDKIVAEVY
ncbi:Antitoxin component of bacterial toxin-antitoxin system, MqsA [uncultured archaeon]|nr:Antitoxin component of bacterial toxin-antitoxin system, MqsA [uncultured archaeon]